MSSAPQPRLRNDPDRRLDIAHVGAKAQAGGLKTIETFRADGTPPVPPVG